MTWYQDEVCRSRALSFFLDANSVERVVNAKAPKLSLVFWGVFVHPDYLVVGFAILRPQKVWPLVLRLFEKNRELISRVLGCRLELGLDRRVTPFLKDSNEVGLFWGSISIKLNRLRMLEVRHLMVNFFLLVLGVLSNATPGGIYKSPWVTLTLLYESLEFNTRQKSHFFDYKGQKL